MDRKDKALERRLQDVYRVEPPEALHGRLLKIAAESPRHAEQPARSSKQRRTRRIWLDFRWRLAVPALSVAAVIAVLWTAGVRISPDTTTMPPDTEAALTANQEAVRDFVIVMGYLQAYTARVNREVNSELGAGLMTAFERGEQSFKDSSNRVTNEG